MLAVMRQLAEEGMTMLVVTHEMGFARYVSNKVVFMEGGLVVEEGPSKEFFQHPRQRRSSCGCWAAIRSRPPARDHKAEHR